jgi:hypothetical protein
MPPFRNFDFTQVGNGEEGNTVTPGAHVVKGSMANYDKAEAIKIFDMASSKTTVDPKRAEEAM